MLPTRPDWASGKRAEGFVTPQQDLMPQVINVPPRRVLPIIFLPGIMGSNLRLKAERQAYMNKENNVAWRPESLAESNRLMHGDPARRQLQLDPSKTEVDDYNPLKNPTGNKTETSDQRHSAVKVGFRYVQNVGIETPLLVDDPITAKGRKTKEQKACERGWGEVFFDSYRDLLEMCELHLNSAFYLGQVHAWWKEILDVPPAKWQASAQPPLQPLKEETLKKAVEGCWFPVHAMGYNWLQSNRESGKDIARRIKRLIERYEEQGFQCEKVIVMTHSMGGLVARALIHPAMGNLEDKVLGIVHGVMPAAGAAAAYKRMRCGFEDSGVISTSPVASITAKVLGNYGPEVTAVLGNSQGGLELLPSKAYGNNWLRVAHKGKTLKSLPQKGDPYEEIYKLRGKWYGLLREHWINPAGEKEAGFGRTAGLLDKARAFHEAIASTYHDQSYGHYGAGLGHPAWHNVVWRLDDSIEVGDVDALRIVSDDTQGCVHLVEPNGPPTPYATIQGLGLNAKMQPANDPGDQTVPLHSAEHQLSSGKFKGVFRQTGYEHQDSYKNEHALHSTLYSIIQIAKNMIWSTS